MNPLEKQIQSYKSVFMIENWVRVSMHNVMVKREGTNYFHEGIFPAFKVEYSDKVINVVTMAIETKNKENKQNLKLGYDRHFLWYLDYRDLITLLEIHWDSYFHLALSCST